MKIFLDTANVEEIKRYAFLADGVTTNPSLIAKEGRNFETVVKEICEIVDGAVSAEAVSLNAEDMVKEARALSKMHPNVVIKIPMTEEGLKAVKVLSKEGIKTNVTLVFSANQALLAAKAGATFVSPFLGRLDDISHDGIHLIEEIVKIYKNYGFKTEIIAASIRNPVHVVNCALAGAHIATIPTAVVSQMFKHNLTDSGIEKFLKDWEMVKNK